MKNLFFIFIFIQQLCNAQTISSLRSDGVLLKNGVPFFPIGFYAESFNTLQENNYASNILSAAGFNIMFTEHDINITPSEFGQFLDNCATNNISNIISFYDPSPAIDLSMQNFIPLYKNKPSVLIWAIADDASTLGTEADILRKHNLATSLDPNHVTSESFNGPFRELALATVGRSGVQAYPKFLAGDLMDGYDTWPRLVELVTKCTNYGKTPIANLQTYKWTSGNFIYPSAAECDVQSYLAIVAGVKGIEYYTFKDGLGSTINITQPNLWNAAVNVAGEINSVLKPIILNGVRTTVANTLEHVYYAKWIYNNETYIIAVNVDQIAHGISIPVVGSTLGNIFNNRPATLTLNGNNVSGLLQPLQTQIYKVTSGVLSINNILNGEFNIVGRHSGLSLEASGTTNANSSVIQQNIAKNIDAQKWIIETTGNGFYSIKSKYSNKVLSVKNASSMHGEVIEQSEYSNSSNQHWKIIDLQNGYYKLLAKHSSLVLGVKDASTSSMAAITQSEWNGDYSQQWLLRKNTSANNSFGNSLIITPNPTKNIAHCSYKNFAKGAASLVITDLKGSVLFTKNLSLQKGLNTFDVDINNLKKGIYMVNLHASDGDIQTTKLFVE